MFDDFHLLLSQLDQEEISIEQVYDHCFQQILRHEQEVNALITKIDAQWIEKLKTKARELSDTPLRGLPVLIKDSIMTRDLPTSNGLDEMGGYMAERDATVVERIRQAGGVIMGKTNLPPAAMDYQTINPFFGTTNNPYDHSRTVGGSSGGSAAAVSLEYAPLALGSDLGGSLRVPAGFCGITALRPSLGAIPVSGHMAPQENGSLKSTGQNFELTIGPMAKDLSAVSYLMTIMRGKIPKTWSKGDETLVASPKLGDITPEEEISNLVRVASNLTKSPLVEPNLNLDLVVRTHASMVDYVSGAEYSMEVSEMREAQLEIRGQIERIIGDASGWIIPVTPMRTPLHNPNHKRVVIGERLTNYWIAMGYYSWPASVSGLPAVVIPGGKIGQLPVGLQIIGKYGEDIQLLDASITICKIWEQV